MQASPTKLLSLLGENKVVFKVPVYQRNYEWNKEQVKQYFYDIERIISKDFKKNHFVGTIVFVTNEIENLMREMVLIDGQQRIITTVLLLKAILDLAEEDGLDRVSRDEISESYLINRHSRNEKSKLKLKPVKEDMQAYKELINGNESQSKIYENYKLLRELITRSSYGLEKIYRAMMQLDIVYISLDKEENPQVIFESLNSTGLSLTEADLIRNFILMGLEYDKQTELYEKYWVKIEKLLPNKIISDYVRDFLTMKESKVPNKNKVYSEFKNYYFSNNYDSEAILKELLKYAGYYEAISNNNIEDRDIYNEIFSINKIRSTVTYPFLLRVFDDHFSEGIISRDELHEVLEIIVSYIYRRNICNIPTNALNKVFAIMSRETRKLREEGFSYVDGVVDYLMSRSGTSIFPRDEEFRNNFINEDLYNKSYGVANWILYNIERKIHKELVALESLSIEHIMPQTLSPEWNIELGHNAYETHRLYKDTIGNLTLTNYNSEMSNKNFLDKRAYYKNSNIKTTRDIAKLETWTDKEILARAEELFTIGKEIWKLPKDNYQNIGENRLIPHQEYGIVENVIVTGYTPKAIIFDGDRKSVKTWKEFLTVTCSYLYDLDEELFKSLLKKTSFQKLLSYKKEDLREPRLIKYGLYVQTSYSAKDILNYVVLLAEEFGIEKYVFFQIS